MTVFWVEGTCCRSSHSLASFWRSSASSTSRSLSGKKSVSTFGSLPANKNIMPAQRRESLSRLPYEVASGHALLVWGRARTRVSLQVCFACAVDPQKEGGSPHHWLCMHKGATACCVPQHDTDCPNASSSDTCRVSTAAHLASRTAYAARARARARRPRYHCGRWAPRRRCHSHQPRSALPLHPPRLPRRLRRGRTASPKPPPGAPSLPGAPPSPADRCKPRVMHYNESHDVLAPANSCRRKLEIRRQCQVRTDSFLTVATL